MAHKTDNLDIITNKAAHLHAVLFMLRMEKTNPPITDNLIDLAYELSDSVACWLIEKQAQQTRG